MGIVREIVGIVYSEDSEYGVNLRKLKTRKKKEVVSVRLPLEYVEIINKMIKYGLARSKSEALMILIENSLEKFEKRSSSGIRFMRELRS